MSAPSISGRQPTRYFHLRNLVHDDRRGIPLAVTRSFDFAGNLLSDRIKNPRVARFGSASGFYQFRTKVNIFVITVCCFQPICRYKSIPIVRRAEVGVTGISSRSMLSCQAFAVLSRSRRNPRKAIRTAQTDVELVSRRLKAASEDYEARYGKRKK